MKVFIIITAALALFSSIAAASCNDYLISISSDNFIVGEKMEFSFSISSEEDGFIIEYWIEDEWEKIIKPKRNTSSLSKKSFTPKEDYKSIMIRAVLHQGSCISETGLKVYPLNDPSMEDDGSIDISFSIDGVKGFSDENELLEFIPMFMIGTLALLSIVLILRR